MLGFETTIGDAGTGNVHGKIKPIKLISPGLDNLKLAVCIISIFAKITKYILVKDTSVWPGQSYLALPNLVRW